MNAETSTALAIPEPTALASMFRAPQKVDALLDRITAEVRSHAADTTTKKGRDAIKSLAYKVSQSKTALDEAGKSLNDDARKQIGIVDAERRKIREKLDALRDEARKPLDDWEVAEATRVQALKDRMAQFTPECLPVYAVDLRPFLALIEAVEVGADWQEWQGEAQIAKSACVKRVQEALAAAEEREAREARIAAEQEELAQLRAEKAAREEADRIAAEAAAKAEADQIAAEEAEQRRIEAEKVEAELQQRIEREKQEAADRAAKEAEARAAQKAEEDEARHRREVAEAEARVERAAQAERDRIAAEAKAEADARAKREADTAHRARIKSEIAAALSTMAGAATPDAIAEALIGGKIPHCTVRM